MSPKISRKISHSGEEISLYWPNFSKEVRHLKTLTDKQEIYNYL